MSEGQVAALLLWLVLLAFSLNASLLRTLHANPLYQHLCLGSAIVLVPLWTLRAGLHEGLEIHFLGLTSLTLLLGWRLALLAPCLTLLILGAFGVTDLAEFGWQALIGVALPVATSWLLFLASWAWLPRHLFVYLFVAAFLGGGPQHLGQDPRQRPADEDERRLPLAHHQCRLPLHLAAAALPRGPAQRHGHDTARRLSTPLGQHLLRQGVSGAVNQQRPAP